MINSEEAILRDEEISVYVDNLAESQITIGTRVWVPTESYWKVKWSLLEKYKEELTANGIEIPYNQLSVTLKQEK